MFNTKFSSVPEVNNIKSCGQGENKNFESYQIAPEHNFIENSLVILTKQTLDIFLRQENPSELISLYTFYYYTAKWQQTNQPKCTTNYVSKGLHWDFRKVRRVKKQLIEFGLIEDARIVDPQTKRVQGYYIKMNYIFKKETLEKARGTKSHPVENCTEKNCKARGTICHPLERCTPNALSANNLNALSADNLSKKGRKSSETNPKQKTEVKKAPVGAKENKVKKETEKKKPISFDELIDKYTENEDLQKELKEHLKTRRLKKAALSNRAVELSLKKLDKLADSDEEKILIVQNAIMNGWTTFYPLKADEKRQLNDKTSYNLNNLCDEFGTIII